LLNIETAPGVVGNTSTFDVAASSWQFHANAYQRLPQVPEQVRLCCTRLTWLLLFVWELELDIYHIYNLRGF